MLASFWDLNVCDYTHELVFIVNIFIRASCSLIFHLCCQIEQKLSRLNMAKLQKFPLTFSVQLLF